MGIVALRRNGHRGAQVAPAIRTKGIFLSYRRTDSGGHAGRLYDALGERFGEYRVYRDVDSNKPGSDFVEAIETAIEKSGAVVAVIGPTWLTVSDPEGRPRLDDPDDLVRREIVTGLERGRVVVPVLVGGATMPRADALPDDLRALAGRHAIDATESYWDAAVAKLVETLEPVVGSPPWWRWRPRSARALLTTAAAVAGIVGTVVTILAALGLLPSFGGSGAERTALNVLTPRPAEFNVPRERHLREHHPELLSEFSEAQLRVKGDVYRLAVVASHDRSYVVLWSLVESINGTSVEGFTNRVAEVLDGPVDRDIEVWVGPCNPSVRQYRVEFALAHDRTAPPLREGQGEEQQCRGEE